MNRPEELACFLFSVCIIDDDFKCLSEIIDFLKLFDAVSHQSVSFGHFNSIFIKNRQDILEKFGILSSKFRDSYTGCLQTINEILDAKHLAESSPIASIARKGLCILSSSSINSVFALVSQFNKWVCDLSVNPLPSLIPPEVLMNPPPQGLFYSPLPSSIQMFPTLSDSISIFPPQSLLYLSLLHATQRKTAQSIDEITQFCLKMTESGDETSVARAAVSLSQVFSIIGLKLEALRSINESIDNSKHFTDQSVVSSAVALRASLAPSDGLWKHAASMASPHPIAKIVSALNNSVSSVLKLEYPLLAASLYAKRNSSYQIASALPTSQSTLPIIVYSFLREAKWKEAAELISKFDISKCEVRATALAIAVAYSEANCLNNEYEFFSQRLNDVMSLDVAEFEETKPLIVLISNVIKEEVHDPLDSSIFARAKWCCENTKSYENIHRALEICSKCRFKSGFEKMKKIANDILDGCDIEFPAPIEGCLQIEQFLMKLQNE